MTTMPKVIRVDSLFTFRNLIHLVTLGGEELSSFVQRPLMLKADASLKIVNNLYPHST
jgi:hypothetical protein